MSHLRDDRPPGYFDAGKRRSFLRRLRIAKDDGARPVAIKASHNTPSAEQLERFLEHLAVTSNVKASAACAGIESTTLYRRRRKDPGFYRAWMEALAEGYEELEMTMLGIDPETQS